MYEISEKNNTKFITKAMNNGKVKVTQSGKTFADVKIQRDIFQGDSLSPLLSVIIIIPLTCILQNALKTTN